MKYITDERVRWHDEYCNFMNTEIRPASIGDDWLNVPFISQVHKDLGEDIEKIKTFIRVAKEALHGT